ncbi:MAG: DUF5678 domain-containing protein [Armatimonadota bacterium]|nr:DUF5678 domain-containing protein [Armatimonadota bacterium]MDR7450272.1 DUF5678 domain-containing protein [Armatimonadota bacterium]MDR7467145.1 DUF5678 domain-containing protein [Armatimonadota bacterium]MDR7493313.1 DUF5678 domain-containing protein [Armatimonadota bacterium]MDR7499321.1 DUF5678 domain-containing protein [Armatimonadota bacterium]
MAQGQETATLYLRGMPRALVREAKAEAARRGLSLTAFVRQALVRALGREGDEGSGSIRPDLEWFEAHRARLAKRYRNEYVAIINRRVVDHDRDFGALALRVFARYGYRSIAMPLVTPQERTVHLRSPRVVAS